MCEELNKDIYLLTKKAIGENAISYFNSYKLLAESHYQDSISLDSWYSRFFFPMTTLLAFGVELSFKEILIDTENRINENFNTNTHDLEKLFHAMEKSIKKGYC